MVQVIKFLGAFSGKKNSFVKNIFLEIRNVEKKCGLGLYLIKCLMYVTVRNSNFGIEDCFALNRTLKYCSISQEKECTLRVKNCLYFDVELFTLMVCLWLVIAYGFIPYSSQPAKRPRLIRSSICSIQLSLGLTLGCQHNRYNNWFNTFHLIFYEICFIRFTLKIFHTHKSN